MKDERSWRTVASGCCAEHPYDVEWTCPHYPGWHRGGTCFCCNRLGRFWRRLRGQGVKLAIADPPYPPFIGAGGQKNRASRWYGKGQRSVTDKPSDQHPDAAEWDDLARHKRLLDELLDTYDGFAIATSPDGLRAYLPLPAAARPLVWVKPNAQPGAHRLRSMWEAVILYPAIGRRSNRGGVGQVPDVLVCPAPRRGFAGAKPAEWTRWVLDAMSYDPDTDTVDDLFHGSGSVADALAEGRIA